MTVHVKGGLSQNMAKNKIPLKMTHLTEICIRMQTIQTIYTHQ